MKPIEIKPDYYDTFRCIAGDCPITCCQEWKITNDDGSVIALDEEKKCPHLTKKKLCELVLRDGDGALSETCALFPRQIHEFKDRTEYSLAACCPVVAELLREQEQFAFTGEIPDSAANDALFQTRRLLLSVMQNPAYPVGRALQICFYLLLDISDGAKRSSIDLSLYTSGTIEELAEAIEGLAQEEQASFDERNELFLDLAENYRKEGIYRNFLEPLAEKAEQIEAGYDAKAMRQKWKKFGKAMQEAEMWLRTYFSAEIYSELLLPGSSLQDMIIAMQWIGIEYAAIRQALFLQYEEENFSMETIRDTLVYISRMTGYDEGDIREYLENSFESLIWEWGYFALITG